MILGIDVGNTHIVVGGFDREKILFSERISTNKKGTAPEYAAALRMVLELHGFSVRDLEGSIISSVVPSVTIRLKEALSMCSSHPALVVKAGIRTGIRLKVDFPEQQGADLIVGAVAGAYEYPCPQILIDMGTATTVSALDRHGDYIGKMILPGVSTALDGMISRTSQLPKVALELPKKLIGNSTEDSIKGGMLYGNAGALDGIIDRMEEILGPCTIVATGGLAHVITPLCRHDIILDDDLLMKGLKLLYERNVPMEQRLGA